MYHKFLFWKQRNWCKNVNCHFIALIIMKRFLKFMYLYVASFSIRTCFYETSSVFYLKYKKYFHKTISFSESSIKIKVRLHWILVVILLTSAFICNLQMLQRWTKPFCQSLIKFCKVHKRTDKRTLNNQYNFQRPLNFGLLLTFKLS